MLVPSLRTRPPFPFLDDNGDLEEWQVLAQREFYLNGRYGDAFNP